MLRSITILVIVIFILFQFAFAQSIPKSLYVVNTLGENLSFVNLENHSVNPNALTLGLYTNEIKIRNNRGYVINSGTNEIQVINLENLSTVTNIPLGTGTNPYNMDFINDSLAAVSLLFTNQVAIVNVNTGQIVQYVIVGSGPEGVKYFNGKIYVTNTNFNGIGYDPGTVSVIDATNYSVLNTINVGFNPQSADVDVNGNLIVSCTGDYVSTFSQIDVVDLLADTVSSSISLNTFITAVRVNSENKMYISTFGFGVMVYNLNNYTFERDENNPLPGGPGFTFDNQNNCYIVDFNADSIRAYSTNHSHLNSYIVGDGPISVDIYDNSINSLIGNEVKWPNKIILHQNYPNPFNPNTQISFYLHKSGNVTLSIYNMLGQKVQSILTSDMNAGYHTLSFNGSELASGVYFYQLNVGSQSHMRRMILIK